MLHSYLRGEWSGTRYYDDFAMVLGEEICDRVIASPTLRFEINFAKQSRFSSVQRLKRDRRVALRAPHDDNGYV